MKKKRFLTTKTQGDNKKLNFKTILKAIKNENQKEEEDKKNQEKQVKFAEEKQLNGEWPVDNYPDRDWMIYDYKDHVHYSFTDSNEDYAEMDSDEVWLEKFSQTRKNPFIKNKNADFKFRFESRPDGEKIIKMILEKKTVVLMTDWLVPVIVYFR